MTAECGPLERLTAALGIIDDIRADMDLLHYILGRAADELEDRQDMDDSVAVLRQAMDAIEEVTR